MSIESNNAIALVWLVFSSALNVGVATVPPFTTLRPTTRPTPGCGSVKNNTLRSPGYPSDYPNNMNCVYRVYIPLNQELLILFNYFDLERHSWCGWDYLRITNDKNQTVGTYCGSQTGKRVVVVGSAAFLIFRSDSSVQLRGFHLSFTFRQVNTTYSPRTTHVVTTQTARPNTTPTPGCGSVKNNTLRSPGYPSDYPNNMKCVYRVYIPLNQELLILFNYFNLERHTWCGWDYLRITNDKNQTVGTYCGSQTGKRVVVVGSAAFLIFRSDSSVQLRGFHLSFTFRQVNATYSPRTTHVVTQTARPNTTTTTPVNTTYSPRTTHEATETERPNTKTTPVNTTYSPRTTHVVTTQTARPNTTPTPVCGSVRNNTLRSPGYPSKYPGNLHCVYRVNIPRGKDLKIHFHYFHLENHSDCAYDYLKITNGTNYDIGTFCGQQSGALVTVTGRYAVLTFHSDRVVEKTGFELIFSYVGLPDCVDKIPPNVCSALARLNLCARLYNITLEYCAKTCGFCKVTANTTTSTTIHAATSAINSSDTSGTISSPPSAITLGQISRDFTPKSSGKPPEAASNEAVMLTVGGLDINKWDSMEDDFKAEVARTTTQYCNTEQAECVTSSRRSRRRRSSDTVFSPNMVYILPGYPKQSPKDPKNAMLAFYLSLSPDISQGSVISKEILTTVIKSNMKSIGGSMNGSIVSVDPLSSPSAAFQSNDDRNNKSEANRTVTVAGSVGGSLFVVLIAVLLVVYKKNKRPRVGIDSTVNSNVVKSNNRVVCESEDPDLEMKECVDESIANATNEVTPQSRSLHTSADQDHPNSTVNDF